MREGGWTGYYIVAFAFKTPLPLIALSMLAAAGILRRRAPSFALPFSLVVISFAVFAFATKKNIGIRYLLPVFPLLHVCCSALFTGSTRKALALPSLLLLAALASAIASRSAPIAYFNGLERFFGGKRQVLIDSNLDWGQALPDLREWMEREKISLVQLAYFGRVDPTLYGIDWRSLPAEPVSGPVAISASLAMGRPYVVRWKDQQSDEPSLVWSREESWQWLRDLTPDEELGGGSILVWKDISKAQSRGIKETH
jgi:hypothetical protein